LWEKRFANLDGYLKKMQKKAKKHGPADK
jgi:hypothetical protein